MKYLLTGRGALSHPFQTASTFIPSRLLDEHSNVSPKDPVADLDASVPENRPDIEFMYIGNNCTDADIPRTGLFTLLSANIRPKSMGSVRLASSNPRVRPEVDLGYFNDPEDYVPLRKAIRLAQRVAAVSREAGLLYTLNYPGLTLERRRQQHGRGAASEKDAEGWQVLLEARSEGRETDACVVGRRARGGTGIDSRRRESRGRTRM